MTPAQGNFVYDPRTGRVWRIGREGGIHHPTTGARGQTGTFSDLNAEQQQGILAQLEQFRRATRAATGPELRFPERSPEERELAAAQLEAIRALLPGAVAVSGAQAAAIQQAIAQQQEQMRLFGMLFPLLSERSGLRPLLDDTGRIIGFEPMDDAFRAMGEEIQRRFNERTLAALRGELPVDPALLASLASEEQILRETLRRQLGPGFEVSSPGIEALGQFSQRRQQMLDAARRGDLSLAEALGLQREEALSRRTSEFLGRMGGLVELGGGQATTLGAIASARPGVTFGDIVSGLQGPLAFGLAERGARQSAALAAAQLAQAGQLGFSQIAAQQFLGQQQLMADYARLAAMRAAQSSQQQLGLFGQLGSMAGTGALIGLLAAGVI